MRKIFRIAACSLTLFAPAAHAQVIRSDSRLVLVDSIVTDRKGAYLHDLTQKDFKVWEDGKEQVISTFSLLSEASSSGDAQKHNTVLFFDDSSITPQNQHYARDTAARFIESNAGPNRPVSVLEFNGALRVAQNFTDDVDRLKQAVGRAGLSAASPEVPGPPTGRGRRDIAAAFSSYSTRELLSALRDMAAGMAKVPGRKTVVLFSEGFKTRPEDLHDVIDACNLANVAIYPVDIRALSSVGQDDSGLSSGMDASVGTTATPARGRRGGGGGGQGQADDFGGASIQNPSEALFGLARSTGGFVIARGSDLPAGMERIGKEQSEYYVLGYVPAKELEPGACHAIKVKVDRGGANARSRAGYCDAKTIDVLAGTPTQRDLEARLGANATPTVHASMQAPFFYTAADTVRVDLAVDIPGAGVKFTKDKGRFLARLNIIGIAYLPDGGVGARFSDNVKFTLDDKKQVEEFASKPYHYEKQFPMGPGRFELKVVFSSSADSFGRVDAPLTVEPWDPSKFFLSGLALSKSARRAAGTGADLFGDKVALVANGVQFVPAGNDRFRKSDKAYLYGQIYEPALVAAGQKEYPALGVQMILLDAKTEKIVKDSGMARLNSETEPGNPAVPIALAIPIGDLTPGAYIAQIAVVDAGGAHAMRRIGFELEP